MSTLSTRMTSYRTLETLTDVASDGLTNDLDDDLAAATGFAIGPKTGEVDLLSAHGAGEETYSNRVVLVLHATGAAAEDTLTQKIYGRVDGGAPQLIASIVWTIGAARVDGSTATYLWADTAVVTSTHFFDVLDADGDGSDRVCSVGFDAAGYRYLYSLITAQTGDPTIVTSLYRVY